MHSITFFSFLFLWTWCLLKCSLLFKTSNGIGVLFPFFLTLFHVCFLRNRLLIVPNLREVLSCGISIRMEPVHMIFFKTVETEFTSKWKGWPVCIHFGDWILSILSLPPSFSIFHSNFRFFFYSFRWRQYTQHSLCFKYYML